MWYWRRCLWNITQHSLVLEVAIPDRYFRFTGSGETGVSYSQFGP